MHEFRRFIEERMDARGWNKSDLARQSGLSTQHISDLVLDDRDMLDRMPRRSTIAALAKAFQVPEAMVLQHAAIAYGVPIEGQLTIAADDIPDEELLRVLGARLQEQRADDEAGVPASLDVALMPEDNAARLLLGLLTELRERAEACDQDGNRVLADAQTYLADVLEDALEARSGTKPNARPLPGPAHRTNRSTHP